MELIIRNENTLQPMGLIDDYYSIIWNVKYFTAGDFSFSVPMNAHNIELLQKNRFVTRNGLKEIGVIDTVSKQRTTEGQKILTVSGLFANGLLARRIVWNATLLNGRVPVQVRALLDSNIINPADRRRSIPSGSYEEAKTGNFIENPDAAIFDVKINSISANSIVDNWEVERDRFYAMNYNNPYSFQNEQVCTHEENIQILTEHPTTATAINVLLKNPKSNTMDTIEEIGGFYKKIKRVGKIADIQSYFENLIKQKKTSFIDHGEGLTESYRAITPQFITDFNSKTFFNYFNLGSRIDDNGVLSIPTYDYVLTQGGYQFDKDEYWHVPTAAARTDGGSGGLIITSYEVYERTDTERKNLIYSEYGYIDGNEHEVDLEMLARGMLWNALGYKVVLKNGHDVEAVPMTSGSHYILTPQHKLKGYAIYDLAAEKNEDINLSGIPNNAENYSLINNADLSIGTMLLTFSYQSQYEPFLRLGTYPEESRSSVYEIVEGENLQTYAESLLQSFRMGLKARFEESEKLIYFDIYQGENKTLGQTEKRPVIFSRNMDALTGFNITESSKSKKTIIKVKGKVNNSDTPFYAEAGAGSGITRLESFQSLNDVATYSGADYVQSLAQTGELVLNGFERVIDAEIDAKTYKYRQDYNVGDLVTIVIDDFNLSYNVRVLEVCESYDTSGYLITLILGV
jgi:hypothetical protein